MEVNRKMPVLDHGYIQLIETWGSDERIIEAARMSTYKGFLGWDLPCDKCNSTGAALASHLVDGDAPCKKCQGSGKYGDERLLEYLYKHAHNSPFEMAGMIVEVQAPIMVFREWHRHRTQSYNELSGRYTAIPDFNYCPTVDRCLLTSDKNKQAGKADGAGELTKDLTEEWLAELEEAYRIVQYVYESGLKRGIPKELARLPVPVARYSRMRASANLRNWLAFMTLRSSLKNEHAQWEIRQYANALGTLIAKAFPRTWDLYVKY
jgi:thymidylate synthase (FAD)